MEFHGRYFLALFALSVLLVNLSLVQEASGKIHSRVHHRRPGLSRTRPVEDVDTASRDDAREGGQRQSQEETVDDEDEVTEESENEDVTGRRDSSPGARTPRVRSRGNRGGGRAFYEGNSYYQQSHRRGHRQRGAQHSGRSRSRVRNGVDQSTVSEEQQDEMASFDGTYHLSGHGNEVAVLQPVMNATNWPVCNWCVTDDDDSNRKPRQLSSVRCCSTRVQEIYRSVDRFKHAHCETIYYRMLVMVRNATTVDAERLPESWMAKWIELPVGCTPAYPPTHRSASRGDMEITLD